MGWAAARASDPCREAVQRYKRALLWRFATNLPLIASGLSLLVGETSREALEVVGQLHIGAATVAAKNQDRTAVENHIAAAHELADRVGGEAGDVNRLSFGHVDAGMHELGASIAMRSFAEALVQARALKPPASTLTSRRARYLVRAPAARRGHPPENQWSRTPVCRYRAPARSRPVKDVPLYTK